MTKTINILTPKNKYDEIVAWLESETGLKQKTETYPAFDVTNGIYFITFSKRCGKNNFYWSYGSYDDERKYTTLSGKTKNELKERFPKAEEKSEVDREFDVMSDKLRLIGCEPNSNVVTHFLLSQIAELKTEVRKLKKDDE